MYTSTFTSAAALAHRNDLIRSADAHRQARAARCVSLRAASSTAARGAVARVRAALRPTLVAACGCATA